MRPAKPLLVTVVLVGLSLTYQARASAADGVASTAPTALTPLEIEAARTDLSSTDWILQTRGLKVLSDGRVEAAVPAIEALYTSADSPWMQGRALVALASIRGKAMLAEARKSIKSPAAPLRAAAIESLGLIGDPQAAADILPFLKDADTPTRCAAIIANARLSGDRTWTAVSAAAVSTDVPTVRAAATALAYIPSEAGHSKLLELIEHPDELVRSEAAAGLGRIRFVPAIPSLLGHYATDNNEQVRLRCRTALRAYEPQTLVDPLLKVLKGDEPALHDAALRVLSFCGSQKVYDELAAILRASDARYAKSLPLALGLLADSDADRYHDLFVQFIRSPEALVRAQAVKSLSRCRSIDHFGVLRPLLADQDSGVAAASLASLTRFTKGAPPGGIVAYLAEPLKSTNPQVLEAALTLLEDRLSATEATKATAAMEGFLSGADDRLRLHAAKALAVFADEDARGSIARSQGYIIDWSVAGPFPNDANNAGMAAVYPPEQTIDLEKTYALADVSATQPAAAQGLLARVKTLKASWSNFQVKQAGGRFSLNDVPYPTGGNVVYFYATFQVGADKRVVFRLPPLPSESAAEKFVVWFNDQKLDLPKPAARDPQSRGRNRNRDKEPDADKDGVLEVAVPGALVKGVNHVLIKAAVENADVWNWSYFVRLVGDDGKPVEILKFKPVE